MLERILALLIALAGLADRAAGLPAPVRLPVLAILCRGEAAARSFVMDLAQLSGVAADDSVATVPATDEPQRLAASFRLLALGLGAILAASRHPARRLARAPMPPRRPSRPKRHDAALPPPPDTS